MINKNVFIPTKAICIAVLLMIITFVSMSSAEAEPDGMGKSESTVSLSMALEQFVYEEHVPEQSLDSYATVGGLVMGIELLKHWDSMFAGVKATVPAVSSKDEEVWTYSGEVHQTNSLDYGWYRADGFVGYPLADYFHPYGGVRLSLGIQERSDFIVSGEAVAGFAREVIQSMSLLLGVGGEGEFTSKWKWDYRMEYFVPLAVKVTNSSLPGFVVTDHNGYTAEFKCGLTYIISDKIFLKMQVYKGIMHWDGSDWQDYDGGLAKWPENDSNYVGGMLNITEKF